MSSGGTAQQTGIVGIASTFWFMIGGIIDMRRMFRDLAARTQFNDLDNGMVEGNVSLADKKNFEQMDQGSSGPKK